MMLRTGDTFIRDNKDVTGDVHLWVIISNPEIDPMLVVNFSSSSRDKTCTIGPDEHPFVYKATFVRYDDAKLLSPQKVIAALSAGTLRQHSRVSQPLMQRILDGAFTQFSDDFVKLLAGQGMYDYRFAKSTVAENGDAKVTKS